MEKSNINRYEIMCLFQENGKQKKEELIKKIQSLTSGELEEKELETEKLAWPVRMENYLLLHLTTSPEKIVQVKKILQQLSIQYLLINLEKEKRIKIKKRFLNQKTSPASEEEKVPSNSTEGIDEKPTEVLENQSVE